MSVVNTFMLVGMIFVLFLAGSAMAQTDGDDARILDLLEVSTLTTLPSTVYAGDHVNISVNLENTATGYPLLDINADLEPGDAFEIVSVENRVPKLRARETISAVYRLKVKEDTLSGTYRIPIALSYAYRGDVVYGSDKARQVEYITLTVSDRYQLSVSELKASQYAPHIGENVTISARITNTGSREARNLHIRLTKLGATDFGNFVVISPTEFEPGTLAVGEAQNVTFRLRPGEKITPGIYTFQVDANCQDCSRLALSKFTLDVLGKPDLIVSGVDFSIEGKSQKKLVQGDVFSLSVQLDNIGEEQAKTVRVSFQDIEGLSGSRTAYVGSVDEDDSGSALFDLVATKELAPGQYDLEFEIAYLDELDRPQSIREAYTLFVEPAPPADPTVLVVMGVIVLIVIYFILRLIFRQLAMRRLEE